MHRTSANCVPGRLCLRTLTYCQRALRRVPTLVSSKNINGTTGLHLICRFGRLETVKLFVGLELADQHFVAEDKKKRSALHHAAETSKDQSVVQLLLKTTAKKYQLKSAVLEAAMSNPWCAEGLVRLLLSGLESTYRKVSKEERTTSLALTAITYPSTSSDAFMSVSKYSRLDMIFLIAAAELGHRCWRQGWPKERKYGNAFCRVSSNRGFLGRTLGIQSW